MKLKKNYKKVMIHLMTQTKKKFALKRLKKLKKLKNVKIHYQIGQKIPKIKLTNKKKINLMLKKKKNL